MYPCKLYPKADFNPRSPHGERRSAPLSCGNITQISTHAPRTGSDPPVRCSKSRFHSISTHAPRTGSDAKRVPLLHLKRISTHAPRTGSDEGFLFVLDGCVISTHAPRTGSDQTKRKGKKSKQHFNPRSPHGERQRKVTILSIRIIGFAQKVYHKTVLLRISLAENAVILPEKPRNPVRTSLQKAGGLRFARAIRAARPYSISSPSGA